MGVAAAFGGETLFFAVLADVNIEACALCRRAEQSRMRAAQRVVRCLGVFMVQTAFLNAAMTGAVSGEKPRQRR